MGLDSAAESAITGEWQRAGGQQVRHEVPFDDVRSPTGLDFVDEVFELGLQLMRFDWLARIVLADRVQHGAAGWVRAWRTATAR